MSLGLTPSQTVGPFFSHALPWPEGPYVVPEGTAGAFWLRGRVFDGDGEPVPDALVESWQADPAGRFNHPDDPRGSDFRGFGRCPSDVDGNWAILTVRPGRVPDTAGRLQAPHIDLSIFARGLLDRVVTRVYLPDEAAANAEDPVLSTVDDVRRATLVAEPDGDGFRFDIRLQGERETVFFSV
ncbi:MAG TPA: protocatechuate 3,4-dioxygenase subunit alpha [Actinophytocola sp.]|uniref:protocatechuate 3,4-dioxygenase subunit alpha n=1 Tax=Actinophytocola sp. TaxID=1872138 RepID=UPI002DDDAE46|nr:protocatechuate 3,4-dioxygenase subunit alpha [Actinophytocola sp.]HEV2783437.1 protocatechuate 3,4-dioxygenase subunit alpha [Actinophytocola sp.]